MRQTTAMEMLCINAALTSNTVGDSVFSACCNSRKLSKMVNWGRTQAGQPRLERIGLGSSVLIPGP